ncbi:cell division cycle- protein [Puccinia graminis f. sp. tritici]|uniref:M-phase inducer phosphatase n=1 Tax=Puccinia graminis f. sp. tritici TaxID=56615 RepID=A0A5B0NBL0_PUCGR|nr:cell division cycle- protein [Puccinia graminis f. sp. tritici]
MVLAKLKVSNLNKFRRAFFFQEDELEEDGDPSESAEQVIGPFSPTLDVSFASSMSNGTAPPTPSPYPQGSRFTHNAQLAPVSSKHSFPPAHLIAPNPNVMPHSSSPHRMDISPAPISTRCNIPSYPHQPNSFRPHSPDDPFGGSSSGSPSHTLSKLSPTTRNTRRTVGLRKTQSRPNLSSEALFLHPSRTMDEKSSPCALARTSDCMDIDSPSYAQAHHCHSLHSQMGSDDMPSGARCLCHRTSRSTSQSSTGKRSRSDEDEEREQSPSRPSSSGCNRQSADKAHVSSPSELSLAGPSLADRLFGASSRLYGEPSRSFSPFEPSSSPSDTMSPSVKAAAKITVGRKASERPLSGFRFPASKSYIPSAIIPSTTRPQHLGPANVGLAFGNRTTHRRPVLGVVQSSATLFSRHQSTSTTSAGMDRPRDMSGRPASKSRRAISFAATEGDSHNLMLQCDGMVADPDEDEEESELDVSLDFNCSPAARTSKKASHSFLVSSIWPKYTESPIRPNRSASHNDSRLNPNRKPSGAGASNSQSVLPTFELAMASQSPTRTFAATLTSTIESPVGMAFSEKERAGKILPCHKVSDDGLMRISPDTMDRLLEGLYDQNISQTIVIDCRFGYEYEGGHIRSAINIQDKGLVDKMLLQGGIFTRGKGDVPLPSESGKIDSTGQNKKVVLVFHCEYSAMRAPTTAKYLREQDRHMNMSHYPALHYPEVYILEGGYARYFAHSPQHCEGGYVGMDDPSHRSDRHADLNQFRTRESAFSSRAKSFTYGESQKSMKNGNHQKKPVFLFDQACSESNKPRVIFE